MPFIDYETCEPLRIWARLEPRARRVEFDTALAARVHDPMWMLARQWQMGEFKGEDTGSAVLAKLARRLTPVASFQVDGGPLETEDLSLPAEARVERLAIEFPTIARARLGRRFLVMLEELAVEQAPSPAYDPDHYRELFREVFPIEAPAPAGDKVAIARARVTGRVRRVAAALAGRAVDGAELYRALSAGMTMADLPAALAAGIVVGHQSLVLAALESYRTWFAELYPDPPAPSGWDPEKLEYQAACTLPRDDGTVTLTVDEHVTGRLDWSAFDQGPLTTGTASASTTDVRSVIPAPAEFAGMPNPRWWQFEDAAVDLGGFRAQATDLAKIVVAEFALLYGNNWLVVPYRQPIGTLAEIEGVVLTDVFGRRTLVEAATPSSGGKWTSWDLFSLSPGATVAAPPLPQHLFLPAGFGKVQEAPPHETVALVRDESANMVWGVERRVPDGLGAAQDGTEAARRFTDELARLNEPGSQPDEDAPALRYRLGTSVPESWIPFVPVHRPSSTREIRLLRAAMPRFVDGDEQPVRPRTSILRPGLVGDTQTSAYLLDEEEVPRAGVNVNGALRRARWLDGATVVWHGRTVATGRGETDSGLRFDAIEVRDPRVDTAPAEA
jgi:hypothetical protein